MYRIIIKWIRIFWSLVLSIRWFGELLDDFLFDFVFIKICKIVSIDERSWCGLLLLNILLWFLINVWKSRDDNFLFKIVSCTIVVVAGWVKFEGFLIMSVCLSELLVEFIVALLFNWRFFVQPFLHV